MSDEKAIKKRRKSIPSVMPNPALVREVMLADAGLGSDEQVALLRKVIESAKEDLDAEKETPLVFMGELKGVHRTPDRSARAKAREQIIDLLGVKAKDAPAAPPDKAESKVTPSPWMIQVNVGKQAGPVTAVVESTQLPAPMPTDRPTTDVQPTQPPREDEPITTVITPTSDSERAEMSSLNTSGSPVTDNNATDDRQVGQIASQ